MEGSRSPGGPRYVVVVSDADPVAPRVAELWGTPPATGDHVDGATVRRLSEQALLVRRPGHHIHDERLDMRLPPSLLASRPTLVFPSVHRSERDVPCLTVHPLGNVVPAAEVGGRAGRLVGTDPPLMVAALRALDEARERVGLRATYEATHHGPELELPAFFIEIGYGSETGPPTAAVRLFADLLPRLEPSSSDHIAVAVGGGHYAPHFTDLALRRRWAFGHILSRHVLPHLDPALGREARVQTPGAAGFVTARAEDADLPGVRAIGERLRDSAAPQRERPTLSSGT